MGSPFLEQVHKDFENVFLNTKEFARECSWNGYPLLIVEDARQKDESFAAPGVNSQQKIIYCRDCDFKETPSVTERVILDGEHWYVSEPTRHPIGHYIITLERNIE